MTFFEKRGIVRAKTSAVFSARPIAVQDRCLPAFAFPRLSTPLGFLATAPQSIPRGGAKSRSRFCSVTEMSVNTAHGAFTVDGFTLSAGQLSAATG